MKKNQISLKNKIHNYLMFHGNKHTCEKKVIKVLKLLQKKNKKNHVDVLKLAIVNASPVIQIRQIKKKKRKSLTEFPYVLNKKNRIFLGIKFIVKTSKQNLEQEFLSYAKKKNELLKTKEALQKTALIKKKYAFFRWFF